MKTFIFLLCCISVASAQAQSPDANAGTNAVAANSGSQTIVGYQTGVQDGNSRVWRKIIGQADDQGNVTYQTNNAYTELATGLNHLVNGQWVESKEEIDLLADGGAAATNGQHQVYFPGDIYEGQIELVTPDGQHLKSRPLGLSYFDGTNSVLIAQLTNSMGYLVGSNQVIYPDAFMDLKADLRYTYTKAGFEQDIILREQPPTPESLGLNPDSARLQVLTEFFDPPQPTVTASTVPTAAGDVENDDLGFGTMAMVPGKAFLMGTNSPTVSVDKQWLVLDGRQILVEEVPVDSIVEDMLALPESAGTSARLNHHLPLGIVSARRLLPAQRMAIVPGKHPMQLAHATPASRGLVLDYVTLTSQNGYTFRGDTTYYIDGTVVLGGTNIFEGGTVLKYDDAGDTTMTLSSFGGYNLWAFQTGPYRPAIFTSMEDNSVGETISGSSGSPDNTGAVYLNLNTDNYYPNPIQYARFSYAGTAIQQENGTHCSPVVNCQFMNCSVAILDEMTTIFGNVPVQQLYNVLLSNCYDGVQNMGGYSVIVDGENVTVDQMNTLLDAGGSISASFTNCIFTACDYLISSGTVTLDDCVTNASNSGFYQTIGAGDYYLAASSTNRNAGTTNVNSTLLAYLRQKTTWPPILYSNITFSVATNFSPQAQRDTDTPDLGYHYDPLDYIVDQFAITNAILTVTSGAAIASYNEPGIQLQDGSSIVSIGTPLNPNWFVRYTSVQEGTNILGGTNLANGLTVNASPHGSVGPSGQYLFSKFAAPAGGGPLFHDSGTSAYSNLLMQDCELWSGNVDFSGNTNTVTVLQNNLLFRTAFNTVASVNVPTFLSLSNNLIFGTTVFFFNVFPTNYWQAYNNAFDTCGIDNSQGMLGLAFGQLTNGYNAYLNCTNTFFFAGNVAALWPTNVTDIFSTNSLAYQTRPLGNFYQPTNSPLIDKGSTNANLVGLYHFTTQTNQTVEANSVVDIGYHYVATDANGNPLDGNGDGIPDYLEDANGNGIYDAGDLGDWQSFMYLKVLITRPRNGSTLP